jgi:hypothetical protein
MVSGEMLRPAIIETIKKRERYLASSRMICVDCLDLFRSEYVEDAASGASATSKAQI